MSSAAGSSPGSTSARKSLPAPETRKSSLTTWRPPPPPPSAHGLPPGRRHALVAHLVDRRHAVAEAHARLQAGVDEAQLGHRRSVDAPERMPGLLAIDVVAHRVAVGARLPYQAEAARLRQRDEILGRGRREPILVVVLALLAERAL